MKHYYEDRPWGSFEILYDDPRCKVKILTVLPGKRLSLQSHRGRAENWIVAQGQATVYLHNEIYKISYGGRIFIPVEAKHRLENAGSDILKVIEVQTGEFLSEDDIIRYEDDFQRM